MAQVSKIDSNVTGLAYAEEASLGYLPGEAGNPGSPQWRGLEPNSYSDFGGEITTVSPNPINPSRQRRKGVTTDLDASGGFNHNLTYQNLTDLMQGFMFADIRRKGRKSITAIASGQITVADAAGLVANQLVAISGSLSTGNNRGVGVISEAPTGNIVTVSGVTLNTEGSVGANLDVVGWNSASGTMSIVTSGEFPALVSSAGVFTAMGIVPGQWIYIGGDLTTQRFDTDANNGFKRVRRVTNTELIFDKTDAAMVAEAGTGKSIRLFFGDVLKNELGPLIKRRSYHLERTLGAPDTSSTALQSEILRGAIPNEFTMNVPSADLASVDMSFVAIDNEQRTAVQGPKQAGVRHPLEAKEYNTSSDVGRMRLSRVNDPLVPLFAYVTEANISINNNLSPNKAVGVLGAFEVSTGTFAVSGSLTAYFASIEAVQAVRQNADVTFDLSLIKNNTGIVFDMPLVSLGDGRLSVELDNPITLPLQTEAATGRDISLDLDHTLLITYFNYLPNSAM